MNKKLPALVFAPVLCTINFVNCFASIQYPWYYSFVSHFGLKTICMRLILSKGLGVGGIEGSKE